ncbi:integrase [Streptomyces spinosisporus]|uniref:Integrase n=1 Tax=Streptomyces spinosisporus TaxID=2927582 RepID=A0ABS9XWR6_9ACTN|nr:integrase [Streptomyces spinosisporus]MCI3246509.1 integrase [Streptomyces spinosisporus]
MPYAERRGSKWRVRWNTGKKHPETGRWIYDSQGGFDTQDDAIAYGLDRESDIRNDRYISRRDGTILMREYCRTWQQTIRVGHLRRRNVESYIRLYIEPRWGDVAVADIKPSAYRAWALWLEDQPNIGDRYRGEILLVFSMLMDDAVDDGLRPASPVQKKRRRGVYKKKPRERKREMRIEDVHQLACNALAFWGLDGYVYVWTFAMTGMRPAELYGLRPEYCHPNWPASDPVDDPREADREERHADDLERYGPSLMPAIRVQWQHQREEGTGPASLYPPKYESRRTLVIPRFLAELLEMLLASRESEWVFTSINNGPLINANFPYHYWRKFADGREAKQEFERTRLGQRQVVDSRRPVVELPPVVAWKGKRQYLMRHGHKEWLDEEGHSRVATESRMGHELAGVEGLYSNVTPAMERIIAESLQARWERFVVTLPEGWEPPPSPATLPVDLAGWMKRQVSEARGRSS